MNLKLEPEYGIPPENWDILLRITEIIINKSEEGFYFLFPVLSLLALEIIFCLHTTGPLRVSTVISKEYYIMYRNS